MDISHSTITAEAAREVGANARHLPPILTPREFADAIDRSCGAVYHWSQTPKLRGAARRRGRHLLIWRDRAMTLALGGKVPTPKGESLELSDNEINAVFELQDSTQRWPILLSPERLAKLLSVGRSTIYKWVAFGYLAGSYSKKSDGIRFSRNSILKKLFNGDSWK